jgi:L-ascorbate metabolism protein UlaG (beta-lactamase superfamily)
MELTKEGHACVVLTDGDRKLVIDPGVFTDPAVFEGATAVLITHEHSDHFEPQRLRAAMDADPALDVWTNKSVAAQLEGLSARVHVVGSGDAVTVAGFDVRVHGELHAEVHPDIPRIANIGFLISDGRSNLYHPGDSFVPPGDETVETLFVPLNAPWAKLSESIDFARAVRPERAFALHDALLTDAGAGVYGGHLERLSGTRFARVAPGTVLD